MSLRFGLLCFPGVQQLDLTGPYEVFASAPDASVHLVWKDLQPIRSATGLVLQPDTPLGEAPSQLLRDFPVLATVLRAGLPFHQGFLNYFDQSPSAFAAAYRIEGTAQVQVQLDYLSAPSLDGRVLVLVDPMLASGKSLVQTYRAMLRFGTPRQVHMAAVIASPEGVAYVTREIPEATLWVAAVDEKLNEQAYIVPGLGDAGDLAYGSKL